MQRASCGVCWCVSRLVARASQLGHIIAPLLQLKQLYATAFLAVHSAEAADPQLAGGKSTVQVRHLAASCLEIARCEPALLLALFDGRRTAMKDLEARVAGGPQRFQRAPIRGLHNALGIATGYEPFRLAAEHSELLG